MTSASRRRGIDPTSLAKAVDQQRDRIYHVSAILACLGCTLQDVHAPGIIAPELQYVTNTAISMLDRVAAKLDPTHLRLFLVDRVHGEARMVAEGLREAAAQCSRNQAALRTRLTEAASLIEDLVGQKDDPEEAGAPSEADIDDDD